MKVLIRCRRSYHDISEPVYNLELIAGFLRLTVAIKESQLVSFFGLFYGTAQQVLEVDLFTVSSSLLETPKKRTILTDDIIYGRKK